MLDILLVLLRPALLYLEDGQRRYFFHAMLAALADIIIAHTTWAYLYGWPKENEWTISHTLARLSKDKHHPDYLFFRELVKKINRDSPRGNHIELEE